MDDELLTLEEAYDFIQSKGLDEHHAQTILEYCNLIDGKASKKRNRICNFIH